MIPKQSKTSRAAHQKALEIHKSYDLDDPLEQTRRDLWSIVYSEANDVADSIRNRHLDAQDVVDHWYLDLENNAQVSHDFKAHDKVTGFQTISQELKAFEENENQLAYQLWEREFRKWWDGGKQGKKPVLPAKSTYRIYQFKDVETFGDAAWSEQEEEVESLERLRERRRSIRQDDMEDPENPYEDERGNRRLAQSRCLFDRYDPQNPKFKFRGQKGVLGGVYTTTDPEPTYRSSKNRGLLTRALLRSDNVLDIMLAKGMNRNFRFPANKRAKANASKI
jgi:hypothetical protein